MFKKLRNKFLVINMVITSLLMLTAFSTIYWLTYNNIQTENRSRMSTLLSNQSFMSTASAGSSFIVQDKLEVKDQTSGFDQIAPNTLPFQFSELSPSSIENIGLFKVEVDSKGNIIENYSISDSLKQFYQKAASIALKNKNEDTIELNGKQWMFAFEDFDVRVSYQNQPSDLVLGNTSRIYFIDISDSHKTLVNLLSTLIIISIIMLVIIFFISRFYANRAIQPIADAWIRQKQFIADASHELKTPLMIINANYDVLQANADETIQSQQKWLGYIKAGSDRMASLVNDMLTLTKMEEAHFSIHKSSFNMSQAIESVVGTMYIPLKEKDIIFSKKIEPNVFIESDKEKIKQLATILLDNAIKYTEDSGQIEVALSQTKHEITFLIKNSGKGIPSEHLPKVFDRFYRADSSRAQTTEGHGLGLSIAKSIADLLEGKIEAHSIENETTTFTFVLER
ncbi:HAMP domain-containing sensor histidine kinase [Neobacillus sp. WH10]|uniref:sensor histidine kinase n=1 Tax=Neobacillus sp. WH10 TaxID=3047873 RepID=UPI0024C12EA2|nr:HAMP domain-containing sensor histidine kinase [Neobacillus sp. WH10]WHY79757.1 HAMP domain-containing sensor histidine kinase [Neobacillus sp. WH10]